MTSHNLLNRNCHLCKDSCRRLYVSARVIFGESLDGGLVVDDIRCLQHFFCTRERSCRDDDGVRSEEHRVAGIADTHTPIIEILDEENSLNHPGDDEDMLHCVLEAYCNISPGDYMLLRCFAYAGPDTTMSKKTVTYDVIDTAAMYRAYRCEAFDYHDFITNEKDTIIDEIGYISAGASSTDTTALARRLALSYTAVAIPQTLDEIPSVIAPYELSTFDRPFVLFAKKGVAHD